MTHYPSYQREEYGERRMYSGLSQETKPQYTNIGVYRYMYALPIARNPMFVKLAEEAGVNLQELTDHRMHFGTPLEHYLQRLDIKNPDIAQLVERYQLCQENDECIFFWRTNKQNYVLSCNVVTFDEDCNVVNSHRMFGDHNDYYDRYYSFGTTFFGGYLLAREDHKKVAVVQEELTALLGAYRYPQLIWVALGHNQQLTKEHLDLLGGRRTILYPDHHSKAHWELLAEGRPNINISSFFDGKDAAMELSSLISPNVTSIAQEEPPEATQQMDPQPLSEESPEEWCTLSPDQVPF